MKLSTESFRLMVSTVFPDCPTEVIERSYRAASSDLASEIDWTYEIQKPYGRNRICLGLGDYGISVAEFNPGQSTSLHYHQIRREFFLVAFGELELTIGSTVTILHTLDYAQSTPGIAHRLRNLGKGILTISEIFSPALIDDKVRLDDKYQRKLGPVLHND